MGISTLASYKGAQIFEALGLNKHVVAKCFKGTASRVEGVGFHQLALDAMALHEMGFPRRDMTGSQTKGRAEHSTLRNTGEYHWRDTKDGVPSERHLNDPVAIAHLRAAARTNSPEEYAKYASITDTLNEGCNLRGMLAFKSDKPSVDLSKVEPASQIVRIVRFPNTTMTVCPYKTDTSFYNHRSSGSAPAPCRTAASHWKRTPRWRGR
jgi:glutamate synthase (NADPH/NADH)